LLFSTLTPPLPHLAYFVDEGTGRKFDENEASNSTVCCLATGRPFIKAFEGVVVIPPVVVGVVVIISPPLLALLPLLLLPSTLSLPASNPAFAINNTNRSISNDLPPPPPPSPPPSPSFSPNKFP